MIPSSYKPIQGESPPRSPDDTSNQESVREGLLKKVQEIDKGFVVSKLFYFFFYTALGALFPFFSLYYKQLWLTPSQIGILLALRPTVKLICLPLWKVITDKYRKPKAVYIISIFGWLIGYYGQTIVYNTDTACYSLKTIPRVHASNISTSLLGKRELKLGESKLKFDIKSYLHEKKIPRSVFKRIIGHENGHAAIENDRKTKEKIAVDSLKPSRLNGQEMPRNELYHESRSLKESNIDNIEYGYLKRTKMNNLKKKENGKESDIQKQSDNVASDKNFASSIPYKLSTLRNSETVNLNKHRDYRPDILEENGKKTVKQKKVSERHESQKHLGAFQDEKISKSPKPAEDFRVQYNFWIFRSLIVIIILTEIITSPTPMIADSAVIQSLAGSNSDYGKQRLFGFFGLGLAAILVAVWVSYTSYCNYTDTINYIPCFYIFMIAIGATVFVSLFFDFKTPENNSEPELFETLKIFKSPRYGFFLFTIFVTGFAHSLQIAFLFWFLQDIGGTPTLFATIILVHSLSEVVMYFLSGFVNKRVGYQGLICIALACYTTRFLMYGFLAQPWLILPMEMVQGVTYGGVWSASAGYIQAPSESTKMIQSILHGMYWGVGMAVGALVSGFVIDEYGVQNEFLVMSLIMSVMSLAHLFILLFDRVKEMEETLQKRRDSGIGKLSQEKKDPKNFIGAAAAPLVPCLLYGR